jgi:N-acetylneuraminic acid mutarotase
MRPLGLGRLLSRVIVVLALTGLVVVAPSTVANIAAARGQAVSTGDRPADAARGRWSKVPPAPLQNRYGAAAVAWTGRELLVWGGASRSDKVFGDGAAYDLPTKRWRKLPPAPISPRTGAASVWTGHELIVWGGFDGLAHGLNHGAVDGASYNPDTDSWTPLPLAPLAARAYAVVTWTGTRMVVLGGQPAVSSLGVFREYTDGAAYDPGTRTWTPIPAPVDPVGRRLSWESAVATPHGLLAWAGWNQRLGWSFSAGADLFSYDPTSGRWTYVLPTANFLGAVGQAVWTGQEVFVAGDADPCPGEGVSCVGGSPAARIYRPDTNTWTVVPDDPRGALGGLLTLVGDQVLVFRTNGSVPPTSTASAYDLTTNEWEPVAAPPPFFCEENASQEVFTGKAIPYYCPADVRRQYLMPHQHLGSTSDGLVFTTP